VRLNASVNVGDFRTGTAAIFKAVWSNTTKQEAADDGEGRKTVRRGRRMGRGTCVATSCRVARADNSSAHAIEPLSRSISVEKHATPHTPTTNNILYIYIYIYILYSPHLLQTRYCAKRPEDLAAHRHTGRCRGPYPPSCR
jgi:hypothetical protein